MTIGYTVRLVARQEGVEYRAAGESHHFDVLLTDGAWQLFLPGSRGDDHAPHELTEDEAAEILPRIVRHLEHDRIVGVAYRSYPVRIVRRPAP